MLKRMMPNHELGLIVLGLALVASPMHALADSSMPAVTILPTTVATTEAAAARAAVERYFAAVDSGNAQAVRATFLPSGRIEGNLASGFVSWTADEFATRNFRGTPPARSSEFRRQIEWVDVTGSSSVVRITNFLGNTQAPEYFLLFKVSGEWKIALKAL
ncbi:MAG: nuclear transport factor 2 family protein [Aquidulcibacter sp.]|jgi:hypothetical protein|uniref:nuclear transport factor 2 family protein n=1 Tax=Aquidulcibacter sp. TaxID=2052990 RepID=UPI0022C6D54E|nr:nuclear transport factor 2 family protein [Aquidulcibacter sp.]MCE2892184.1 nuclear transport factor 2 family protein [Hyphomonadaceae bacterium]MCZ8210253.1 nuclear transport factor 2 family protein [Aquidulcibacter sp.]